MKGPAARSIQALQREAIVSMLHFNRPAAAASPWKVLVLDGVSQKILAPIMRVSDLREHGVTLYMQIRGGARREAIPEAPAVYFVAPTAENVEAICADLREGLYDAFHLNFTSALPRALLEALAEATARDGTFSLVANVCDQYLDFVVLEENLFTLLPAPAAPHFVALNDERTSEAAIGACLDGMAASLFSVLLAGGAAPEAPLIVASRASAAEALAERLSRLVAAHGTNARGQLAAQARQAALGRPLVVLVDRNVDLATPLRHSSTYNALVHDILGVTLNRVTITPPERGAPPKAFDIGGCGADFFWRTNGALPFPTVAENVDAALNEYKRDMARVTRSSQHDPLAALALDGGEGAPVLSAEELKVAISVLPELAERKRVIDAHLQIATALLEAIKGRNLGDYFALQLDIPGAATRERLLEAIRAEDGGSLLDKVRLFLVYYLCAGEADRMEEGDVALFERALMQVQQRTGAAPLGGGCLDALHYCRRVHSLARMATSVGGQAGGAASPPAGGRGASPLSSPGGGGATFAALHSLGSRLTSGVLGNIMSSVKNFMPEPLETPITRAIDGALQAALARQRGEAAPLGSPFSIIDPRPAAHAAGGGARRAEEAPPPPPFDHAIVFVVGGTNYAEYNHVGEWIEKRCKQRLRLTFGGAEMVTGEAFVGQLASLHRP